MSRQKPQAETPDNHPETYQRDLNPDAFAGQNLCIGENQAAKNAPTAYDHKQVHQHLSNLTDNNLRQIRVLPEGTRLEQGATYLDLNYLEQGEFTATGNMEAASNNWFVAKKDVPYHLWNILLAIENDARIADRSDKGAINKNSNP